MEILEKAAALADSCQAFTLASVTGARYPRVCVMAKLKNEGIVKAWCSTRFGGAKVRHFLANPKASLCYWKGADNATLIGTVEVKTDRATREAFWQDWFYGHFPAGIDDPGYCVLEFTAHEATYWIDGEFVTAAV